MNSLQVWPEFGGCSYKALKELQSAILVLADFSGQHINVLFIRYYRRNAKIDQPNLIRKYHYWGSHFV